MLSMGPAHKALPHVLPPSLPREGFPYPMDALREILPEVEVEARGPLQHVVVVDTVHLLMEGTLHLLHSSSLHTPPRDEKVAAQVMDKTMELLDSMAQEENLEVVSVGSTCGDPTQLSRDRQLVAQCAQFLDNLGCPPEYASYLFLWLRGTSHLEEWGRRLRHYGLSKRVERLSVMERRTFTTVVAALRHQLPAETEVHVVGDASALPVVWDLGLASLTSMCTLEHDFRPGNSLGDPLGPGAEVGVITSPGALPIKQELLLRASNKQARKYWPGRAAHSVTLEIPRFRPVTRDELNESIGMALVPDSGDETAELDLHEGDVTLLMRMAGFESSLVASPAQALLPLSVRLRMLLSSFAGVLHDRRHNRHRRDGRLLDWTTLSGRDALSSLLTDWLEQLSLHYHIREPDATPRDKETLGRDLAYLLYCQQDPSDPNPRWSFPWCCSLELGCPFTWAKIANLRHDFDTLLESAKKKHPPLNAARFQREDPLRVIRLMGQMVAPAWMSVPAPGLGVSRDRPLSRDAVRVPCGPHTLFNGTNGMSIRTGGPDTAVCHYLEPMETLLGRKVLASTGWFTRTVQRKPRGLARLC